MVCIEVTMAEMTGVPRSQAAFVPFFYAFVCLFNTVKNQTIQGSENVLVEQSRRG